MELTALKVKIGLNQNGHAKYPKFGDMFAVIDYKGDWSHYVDEMGLRWHYDKTSGHKEETLDSPRGQQFGMLVVPDDFAQEAVIMFPNECSILNEVECEDFYNNKAHAHESEEDRDDRMITGLKDTLDLMEKTEADPVDITDMKAKIVKALDPLDPEPGVKKNMRKKWADFKGIVNVTIKNPV